MDKKLFFLHSMVMAPDNNPVSLPDEQYVKTDSDLKRLLDSIFTVDQKTGLPMTDLQYYLNSNSNPTVREWLINNLMKPRADKLRTSVEGVTDDMLFEFTRKPGEEIEDYRDRVYQLGVEAKAFADAHREEIHREEIKSD